MQMQTLAIIPTYNERDNIQPLVTAVLAAEPSLDVLIVDDASPDGTGEIAETLARESSRVRVMHRPGKQGLGTAYVAGFRYALAGGYDRVVEMDADFSHRPEDLPRLLEAAETADVVVGSRKVRGGRVVGWSPLRHILSAGGSLYTRLVLGLPVKDCTSGFMCLHRSVLSALDFARVRSNGYSFLLEMKYLCYRSGFRLVEVPIVFPDRKVGRSKMSLAIILEAMARVWGLRVGLS
jgi:dolichol-phosphate mannosyltransferase